TGRTLGFREKESSRSAAAPRSPVASPSRAGYKAAEIKPLQSQMGGEVMRRLLCVVVLTSCAVGGCLSPGESVPWNRPGLGGGRVGASIQQAIQESDDDMKMLGDRSTDHGGADRRGPTADY